MSVQEYGRLYQSAYRQVSDDHPEWPASKRRQVAKSMVEAYYRGGMDRERIQGKKVG